jgi:hypothetical protein
MATALSEAKLKELYFPSREPVLVRVPKMDFLMADGAGDPGQPDSPFQQAIGCLYGTAYTLKFMFDKGHPVRDTRVQPLEGQFWTHGRKAMSLDSHAGLRWTLMLRLPAGATRRLVANAVARLRDKKDPPGLDRVRFESFSEGTAFQVMHVGPYADEPATIERLMAAIRETGYAVSGRHHEIYLSDPNRTRPEKLKTVIRYPVRRGKSAPAEAGAPTKEDDGSCKSP